MSKKFTSVKSLSFGIFLLSASLLIIFLAIVLPLYSGDIHSTAELTTRILFALIIPVFALWIWIDTNYIIEEKVLTAKSGPMVFKIRISDISVIRLNQKTIGALWRPALSWKSIQIEYNKSDSVFISPSEQERFIAELLLINRDIEIRQD